MNPPNHSKPPIPVEPFPNPELPGEKPPRPANAWIIFRREMLRQWPAHIRRPMQGTLSSKFKQVWHRQTPSERAIWERKAEEAKAEHKIRYPDYKYRPMKKEEKQRLAEEKKQEMLAKKQAKRVASRSGAGTSRSRSPGPVPVAQSARPQPYYMPPTHIPGVVYHPQGPSPAMSCISLPDVDTSDEACGSPLTPPTLAPQPFPATTLSAQTSPLPFPLVAQPTPQPAETDISAAPCVETTQDVSPVSNAIANVPQTWEYPQVPASTETYNWTEGLDLYPQGGAMESPVFFDIPLATFDEVNNWLLDSQAASLDPLLLQMSNNDFPAFALLQFEDNLSSYPGEIEVNFGTLPPTEELPSYLSPDNINTNFASIDLFGQYQPAYSAGIETDATDDYLLGFGNQYENPHSSLPLLPQSFYLEEAPIDMALQPLENSLTSNNSAHAYNPPSGAANSGLRRAGGSYKKDHLYSLDQSSVQDLNA